MNKFNSKLMIKNLVLQTTIARYACQLTICLAVLAVVANTKLLAQYNGSFVDLQPVSGLEHPSAWEYISDMSDDGLEILMSSTRSGSLNFRNWDLYQSTRNSIDEPFGEPERIDSLSRSRTEDGHQTLSSDGLTTFFASEAPNGARSDVGIWTATRETLDSEWSEPEFVDTGSFPAYFAPRLSSDDLTLYFNGYRSSFRMDIFKMERESSSEPFGAPKPISEINTSNMAEFSPVLSRDELTMFYSSGTNQAGNLHIKVATRSSTDEPFDEPVDLDDFGLGSELNSSFANNWVPFISADWPAHGSKLYFPGNNSLHSDWTIYEATWRVYADGDANLDDEVNFADFLILSENFGQEGAWREGDFDGDGIVGFPDFLALSENFGGAANASVAAVPEPTAANLVLFGLLGLIGFRKRR